MRRSYVLTLIVGLVSCSSSAGEIRPPLPVNLALTPVATDLAFPVFLTAPANDPRLFILEKPGRIRIVQNGTLVATPFLDIVSQVSSPGERGLLGLAFHPRYSSNGFFYINYTNLQGDTRIVRYTVSSDPNVATASSATPILAIDQPYSNHNGGMIAFGPDGMLYIGMGDGGSGGDPQNHGQNPATLLGAMLRIDVDGGDPYRAAPGNPTPPAGARPEIWASGLRNPWRFSFDRVADRLYIADVGQGAQEEVNVVPVAQAGVNYGWRIMEGTRCFNPSFVCSETGLTLPVLTYSRNDGVSVTGGYVYRGSAIPEIVGHYFYSDYSGGWLRSFRLEGDTASERRDWDIPRSGNITSFGEDASGELYMMNSGGTVFRIDKAP